MVGLEIEERQEPGHMSLGFTESGEGLRVLNRSGRVMGPELYFGKITVAFGSGCFFLASKYHSIFFSILKRRAFQLFFFWMNIIYI